MTDSPKIPPAERTTPFRPVAVVPPAQSPSFRGILHGVLRADFSQFPVQAYSEKIYPTRLRGRKLFLVVAPERVRTVLVDEQPNYPKSRVMQRLLGPLIGGSMFVSNGARWARQRRMVDPTLELSRLKVFLPLMQGAVDDMIRRIDARDGGEIDVDVETMRVTADILCRSVFSEQVREDLVDQLADSFRIYQAQMPSFLILEALGAPYWLMPHRVLRARREARKIRGRLQELIRERLAAIAVGARPDDLLTGLIEAEDPETGTRFTETDLVDEVVFFFLAGHETTASALSWALYLLANDQSAQDRVRAEVAEHIGPGPAEFSALRRLRFTRDVFREAMRLYPPVTAYIRDPQEGRPLGKKTIARRDLVAVTPWFVHRSPKNWQNPDLFDPDRFQTEAGKLSARGAYLPFSVGPRVCSGAAFATQESLLILADLLARYRLDPVPGREPVPAAWLTQRSRTGTWLRLSRVAGDDSR